MEQGFAVEKPLLAVDVLCVLLMFTGQIAIKSI